MLRWGRRLGRHLAAIIFFSLSGAAVSQTSGEISYTYDELGRLTSVIYSDGTNVQYSYDPAGNRTLQSVDTPGDAIPTVVDDTVVTYLNGPATLDPRANDSDEDGDPLIIILATQGAHGTVTAAGDGASVTYTPDTGYTGSDTFTYTVTDGTHTPAPGNVSVTIGNYISFSIDADAGATEGSQVTFTVSKSGTNLTTENVTIATTSSGTAVPGTDYATNSQVLTFAPAELSKTFAVLTTGDAVYENNETFTVQLSIPSAGATLGTATRTGTISNNSPGPAFSVNDASATESGIITFTVMKSGLTALSHNVSYATANAIAVAGSDYTSKSGTLTFAAGDTSKTIAVSTTQDSVDEQSETLQLNLSAETGGATISDSQGIGTIIDDDGPPSFAISDAAASEGNVMTFTVTKTGATIYSYSVDYATASGSATSGTDFAASSGTLTFGATDTSRTFAVATIGDSIYENNETLTATLVAPTGGSTITDGSGTGTVSNDDTAPSFTINDASIAEGGFITFTVTKLGSTALSHDVTYATANGTASAGSDYSGISATVLTFTSAQTSKTVIVSTIDDAVYENSETLNVNLSAATSGATIADSQGVGTINNDDTAPSFTINDASIAEGGLITFTVTKSGSTALSHNITYATATGSGAAIAGTDYTAVPASVLTFTAAQTSKTVTVTSIEDALDEFSEAFFVNLTNATNGAAIGDSQGQGVIVDDDPGPSFAINNASATEGSSVTFTITKTGATGKSHNVAYATANGTAAAGSDYTLNSGTLTFAAAQTSKTVIVTTIDDAVFEGNETLNVNLSAATNTATISDSQGVGTINDNDAPNNPPVAMSDSGDPIDLWNAATFYVLANDSDPDGDPLTITSVTNPAGNPVFGQILCGGTCIRVTTLVVGFFVINYQISDGNGGTDVGDLFVSVSGGGPLE